MAPTTSVEPRQWEALPKVSGQGLDEPGAYVERGTGDLHRVPRTIVPGASPPIRAESLGAFRPGQPSRNLFIGTLAARPIACEPGGQKGSDQLGGTWR